MAAGRHLCSHRPQVSSSPKVCKECGEARPCSLDLSAHTLLSRSHSIIVHYQVSLFLFPSDINIGKNKRSVSQHSILVQLLWCKPPPPPPPPPPTRPNGEWGYSTRRHMLGPERPEAVLPDRAFYLPTLSHLLIVNVNLHSHECPAAVSP